MRSNNYNSNSAFQGTATNSEITMQLNIKERVAAAIAAIQKKYFQLVEILDIDTTNGNLSIVFKNVYNNNVIEAYSENWKTLKFFAC